MLWVIVGAVTFGEGSSRWFGAPVLAVLLAPLGLFCGFLFNLWQDRKVTLSDDALRAELQSMSMESLLEYKALCPPKSREYAFAVAELARRAKLSGEPPG